MSIRATISPGFSLQRNCISTFHKLFHTDFESVKTSLTFNYGEFAIIKRRIIDLFPYTNELKCVSVGGEEKKYILHFTFYKISEY